MFLSHGGRPTKGNGRKRKGVDEYAAENRVDFTSRSIIRDGQLVRILVCRFCCQSIGARSDRIKEHLASKRHQKLKLEAFREAAEAGRDLTQEYSQDGVSTLLPEPPITMLKFPGKALANLLDGDVRNQSREMTPEVEDLKYALSNPPPLKEASNLTTSSPQLSNALGDGSFVGRTPNGPVGTPATPPPPMPNSPQQLLCVRWGNFDSNIISMFTKLRTQEHFVDATLWCEGKTIKCHKMILCACSTYFEKLLTENPNPHPIIFLKDMRYWEISALVEFMYRGEVSIHQEKLQSLLRAAESLQIKGLGSPSNDLTNGVDDGSAGSNHEEDLSNNTMDMSTSSTHSTASTNHLHMPSNNHLSSQLNHRSSSPPIQPIPLTIPVPHHTQAHHLERPLSATSLHNDNNNNNSSATNLSQQSLLNSMNMGMDLSNHNSSGTGGSGRQSSDLINSGISAMMNSGGGAAKRRKKETPRRIDVPRNNMPTLTPFTNKMNMTGTGLAADEVMDDDDDNASEDSMTAHERNHMDISAIKSDINIDSEQGNDDEDGNENNLEGHENEEQEDYTTRHEQTDETEDGRN